MAAVNICSDFGAQENKVCHSFHCFPIYYWAFYFVSSLPPSVFYKRTWPPDPDKITGKIDGEKVEIVTDFIFLGSKITTHGDCSHEIERQLLPGRKDNQPGQHIKKQRHYFVNKGLSSPYGFSSSHVWKWKLEHKESWVLKNWCFWAAVLEKTLESPLDCKEINQ